MLKFVAFDENGKEYLFEQEKKDNSLFLTLRKNQFLGVKKLYLLKELSTAYAGEEGYYIISRNIHDLGDLQVLFTDREDGIYTQKRQIMSFYGIKTKKHCCLIRIERNYNYYMQIMVKNGAYSLTPVFDFTESEDLTCQTDIVHDDIRVEIIFLDKNADYNDMAAKEREIRLFRNEIVTLKEKSKREAVEYARKYPLIRIRLGWKPSPSSIRHQTLENEPEMFTACTFERVREFAWALKNAGVEGAEIQLVGWNIRGHDGRYPQLFPVEENLGGEFEMIKTIEYIKSLGYRISTHTNSIDAVTVADCFNWDDICLRRNGEYQPGGNYSGGLTYHVCQSKQLGYAMKQLPRLVKMGENGLHFTDVVSIILPDCCFHKEHPLTTKQAIDLAQELMEYTGELFGGFSSEGCMDFSIKYIDYGLYVTFGDGFGYKENIFVNHYLPIFEIVYHGTVLYNPTSSTINYPIKKPQERLTFIMRGGRPSFYLYSKFRVGGAANWMGEDDLTCTTEEELEQAVTVIQKSSREYLTLGLADKQFEYMLRYDIADNGLHIATYSDGEKIVGNFTAQEQKYGEKTIPAYDFIIVK